MRCLLLAVACAACAPSPPAGPPQVLRLEARAVMTPIAVDGAPESTWDGAAELEVPLKGGGVGEVRLRALHDGKALYLLAIWSDAQSSMSRYWRYDGGLKWSKFEAEDGFGVCWSPPALEESFRTAGCATSCHEGTHAYKGVGSGYFDFWYWGAQQCAVFPQARDLWLRQGDGQHLRGDRQPKESDNVPNQSPHYDGPSAFPTFRANDGSDVRILPLGRKGLMNVTPDWIQKHWIDEKNIGREVPLDLLQERKGSRGDVAYGAQHHDAQKTWVLELRRALDTENIDDLRLGIAPVLFAVAVWDNEGRGAHAVSGPIELRFLPLP